ncbi:MAG TPA: ABC transporter permease subunit [Bacteroidales bacterium]|nr:ABC transporter permease subunit [Bacteroidales bacterium]
MNWNLFIKEMRRNALSLVLWMIAIVLLISLTMSVYRTVIENQTKIMGMMSLVPKGALQFKGISNFNDIFSVLGFYAANNVIYMMVLGSIFAIVLSSNILLKEEYNKTAEYLLTKPLTRSEIFFSKLAVIFLYIFLLNLVAAMAGLICMELVKQGPYNTHAFLILSVYTLLLNLLFGAIGLFMSTLVKRPKPITTFSIGLVLIFYFISTISKITDSISRIGYLSPFNYANTNAINPDYKLGFWHLLYFTGISLILTGISFRLYNRKDIYL